MTKTKEVTVNDLEKKLDRVVSEYVRRKEKGICYTCGNVKPSWKYQEAGHYKGRISMGTRFDERNIHCQCRICNQWMGGNKEVYKVKLVEQYGPGIIEELDRKSSQIKVFDIGELQDLIKEYKMKIKKVKSN